MKLTKSQLHQLIREEYARVILESKGYNPSQSQVQALVESLDEGIFGSLGKAFKSGKEAYRVARAEDQERKNDAAISKTEEQLKKELAGVRMKAKDKLMSNGYVGENEGDTVVLAVDLFNSAVKDVMRSSEVPSGAAAAREPGDRTMLSIRHR